MKIYSVHFNRPDFVFMQARTFRHFLPEHELVIVNNARTLDDVKAIKAATFAAGVTHVNPMIEYPGLEGLSHQAALRWIVEHMQRNAVVMIVDHDIFAYKPFDPMACIWEMKCMIAGVPQARGHVEYPWPGLLILDMQFLPNTADINMDGYHVEGEHVDSGGQLYTYMKKNHIGWRRMTTTSQIRQASDGGGLPLDIREHYDFAYGMEFIQDTFLHLARGSNWDRAPEELVRQKTDCAFEFLERSMRA